MLFSREGTEYTGRVSQDEKGKPFFSRERKCGRCGGAGRSDKWAYTGYTCFDCNGSGRGAIETVKLYTREQLDRINAAQDKRNAKKLAAHEQARVEAQAEADARRDAFEAEHGALLARAEQYAERSEFLRDVCEKARARSELTENQANALRSTIEKIEASDRARASSEWVGAEKERITATVTVERIHSFERPCFGAPWQQEVVHIVTMRDEHGNALVTKGRFHAEKGEILKIKGTVKEHSEFRNEKQTVLQRVAVL